MDPNRETRRKLEREKAHLKMLQESYDVLKTGFGMQAGPRPGLLGFFLVNSLSDPYTDACFGSASLPR
jgi:hypothetical protein